MNLEKIKSYSQRAGKEVLAVAEAAYLTMKDPKVSWAHKLALMGALTYLLSPIDAIPDFLPGGFGDDLSVLAASLLAVGSVGQKHLKECRIKQGLSVKDDDEPNKESET